jgi:ATP-binding cassette subfamily B multidrug efflux pump
VLIDGRPIREIPLGVLRSSIGYVPQETFLFSETVAENIAFGVEHAITEEIERAATEAGIAEDILEFAEGFETLVGERGITLSGGQKQRTAIARALIRRPKILILDDALSSVDTYTEERILGYLRRIMVGRTSLIVSHRVSTVKDADLIVVLEDGQIAERGTHDSLIARGGIYAELYEKQLLEEELAAS